MDKDYSEFKKEAITLKKIRFIEEVSRNIKSCRRGGCPYLQEGGLENDYCALFQEVIGDTYGENIRVDMCIEVFEEE